MGFIRGSENGFHQRVREWVSSEGSRMGFIRGFENGFHQRVQEWVSALVICRGLCDVVVVFQLEAR